MSKRAKIITIALVLVLLLTIGLTSFALAQNSTDQGNNTSEEPSQSYTDRVASILGIDEEQLIDACKQARQETADAWIDKCLQRAIDNGCINEQEANQVREWWQNRPQDSLEKLAKCARFHIRSEICQHRLLHHPKLCPELGCPCE